MKSLASEFFDEVPTGVLYECVGQIVVIGDEGELVGMVSALDVARHYAVEHGYAVD